jgi:acyl-CoA synthetase (AMP-forming)/AMP-acid ligase II
MEVPLLTTDPVFTSGSIAEVLLARAAQTPDAPAFCFLVDGEEEGPRLSYADLDREARAIAATLQDVTEPGDRALLLYAPGLAFISAFFGCQYAGVVPVPAYPPRPGQLAQGWQMLGHLASDCTPRVILMDRVVAPFVPTGGAVPSLADLPSVVTDHLDPAAAGRWRQPHFDGDALALLQYTSGSTADPKGVMVSHQNLMHNGRLLLAALEHDRYTGVGVSWLPPYHDLGLIGGLLQTVYRGGTCLLMSPVALLQDSLRWLRAVSRYRADISGGPNFAYDLCVQRNTPERCAGLDLSNWRVAAIGAEPVSHQTLERFAEAFGSVGFRPEAFYPCYGLAESTLFVTGGLCSERPVVRHPSATEGPNTEVVVGCGRPWLDQEVRIVDPNSRLPIMGSGVGEIWVRGPSVACGYWNRPAETEETFRGRLADTDAKPFLRTGDLGFVWDGELFVTGRLKDVIIVRGRNHYPQDIEATVQAAHPDLRPGCGAAFEVTRDRQARLVVVQEVDRRCREADAMKLVGDIRQAVAERHELQVYDVVLLEYGSILKTSSGKVRRSSCRSGYENGELRTWKGRRA